MPDALPPVGVLLSALDAATLPLAGTEETFVMQGGQPKRTPASTIRSGYNLSNTYAPTIVASSGTAVPFGAGAPGPLGRLRMGSGAGVPAAGDTVILSGGVLFSGASDGTTIDIPLPFVAASAPLPVPVVGIKISTSAEVTLAPTSTSNLRLTLVSGVGGGGGAVGFTFTYQTANAVDP